MVDTVYNWGRRSSLWPLGFGLACCAIEMICTASSRFDIARFGAEVFRGSPRQADVMIVSGTVTKTMMPMIARLYDQMPEPKYVISMGACATGGGPFKEGYNVVSGIDKYLPGRRLHPRLPADAAGPPQRPDHAPEEDRRREARHPAAGPAGHRPLVRRRGRARHPDPGARPRPDRPADSSRSPPSGRRRAWSRRARPTLVKPAKIPAPQPEPEAEPTAAARPSRAGRAQGAEQDRHDPRQGAGRGRRPTGRAAAAAAPAAPRTGRQARQEGRRGPRPGPASSGSATPGSRSWPTGSTPSSAPGPSRSSRRACSSRPRSSSRSACYLRDKNPIKYDYLASLQSVHYEDCIEVNYQLDSTTKPGKLIELRVRTAEAEGEGEVPSLYHGLARGRFPGARGLRHDGRPLHRPPRADSAS